ncbi:MAG: polymer-forming cytoskeletal protein [Eikenella sp.]|nr:polymer-forming cytoskeletal protein [Eikenella sp.]
MMFHSKGKKELPAAVDAIDTIIGAQCRIQGDVLSQQSVKIDGAVAGNVQAGGMVIIGESGAVCGDIRCAELMVFGRVEGLVEVNKLQLKATAHVAGNIRTQTLLVEEGAVYAGDIRMEQAASAAPLPLENKSDAERGADPVSA